MITQIFIVFTKYRHNVLVYRDLIFRTLFENLCAPGEDVDVNIEACAT
jgi:hypothetical protein